MIGSVSSVEPTARRPHMPGYGIVGPTEATGLLPMGLGDRPPGPLAPLLVIVEGQASLVEDRDLIAAFAECADTKYGTSYGLEFYGDPPDPDLVVWYTTWMRITQSARRHGVSDEAIRHAIVNSIRLVETDEGLFVIGADASGRMLELVTRPADGR